MQIRSVAMILLVLGTAQACARRKANGMNQQARSEQPGASSSANEVVYRSKDGTVLTRNDLRRASGSVDWEIPSSIPVSAEARDLHKRGREAGARGDHEEALRLLAQAAQNAPQWPYPVYDAAFTYLLKGDTENALRAYSHTLELAPRGFFTAITAAHYLKLEAEGKLARGTYLSFVSIEWADSPAERVKRIDAIATSAPMFAPIWKEKALQATNPPERLALLNRGLDEQPDSESRGFLMINKALSLSGLKRKEEAIAILGELAADPSQPLDVQQIALVTLGDVESG